VRNPLADAAAEYLAAGLHILALNGKKPNGRVHGESWSYEDSFHGVPTEIGEANAVKMSFSPEVGTTGIAILIPPDFYVADVDTDRAAEVLLDLGWQSSEDTVVAETKNGLHIWLWYPGADRNRWIGDGKEPDPGRTLLFKGLGGYVVAPPSSHLADDGSVDGTYRWGPRPLVVGGMIQMPDTLPAKASVRFARDDLWAIDRADRQTPVSYFTQEPVEGLKWWQWPKTHEYNTDGLEKAIIAAADGNQNNLIHWAAMVCREEGVPYDVAMTRLLAAAKKGGHPERRARDTIRGAYKRAARG